MADAAGSGQQSEGTVVTWKDLAPLLARLTVLEQQAPDLQDQIDQLGQHLAQQDQAAAAAQQQLRSQLGAVQAKLDMLVQDKEARDRELVSAAEDRAELRRWGRQTFGAIVLLLPATTWPFSEGHPLWVRVAGVAGCFGAAVLLVLYAYMKPPRTRTQP